MKNNIAESYGWENAQPCCSQSYLEPVVLSICQKCQTQTVLDVGTGNGAMLPLWLKQGWKVSAMEPDTDGFHIAKSVVGVDVRQLGVGDDLPSEWKNAFDVVISLEVVEHLFNPHQLVKTALAVLKPGGYAVISTPYHGYLKNLILALIGKWDFHHHPERVGGHIKFFSAKTLEKIFKDKGFDLVEFKGAGRVPFLWKSMVMVFRRPIQK